MKQDIKILMEMDYVKIKNGKKVTFNFAIRNTGADYDQALADTFIKSWKEVGLDVQLVDGKLMSPKDLLFSSISRG